MSFWVIRLQWVSTSHSTSSPLLRHHPGNVVGFKSRTQTDRPRSECNIGVSLSMPVSPSASMCLTVSAFLLQWRHSLSDDIKKQSLTFHSEPSLPASVELNLRVFFVSFFLKLSSPLVSQLLLRSCDLSQCRLLITCRAFPSMQRSLVPDKAST